MRARLRRADGDEEIVFPFGPAARRAGVLRNALYLVQPDGYVALADPSASPARLEQYLGSHGLRPEWPRRAEPGAAKPG